MEIQYVGIQEGYHGPPENPRDVCWYSAYIYLTEINHDPVIMPFHPDFFVVDQAAKQFVSDFENGTADLKSLFNRGTGDMNGWFDTERADLRELLNKGTVWVWSFYKWEVDMYALAYLGSGLLMPPTKPTEEQSVLLYDAAVAV